jgi:subtilase family serine protease
MTCHTNYTYLKSEKLVDNFVLEHPNTPSLIRSAYNVTPVSEKIGKKKVVITIIIAFHYPNLQNDFDLFCKKFNLPQKTLEIINLGSDNYDSTTGWDVEECIDIQWAYSMNPNAHIRVIESLDDTNNSIFNAVVYASTLSNFTSNNWGITDIISMSWGSPDQVEKEGVFTNSNICYLAASGDDISVNYPSVSSNVLSCGGTSLKYDSNNGNRNETTWNVSGNGVSQYISKPEYQNGVSTITSYTGRCSPDISAVGNPSMGVQIIYNSDVYTVGGTSLSTPIIAGIISNLIQTCINSNITNFTNFTTILNKGNSILLQDILYKNIYNNNLQNSIYKYCMYDITNGMAGNNSAGLGYDLPTGIGSINCNNLISTILNILTPPLPPPPPPPPVPVPVITKIQPTIISTLGGTFITITGYNFKKGLTVTIGNVPCTFIVVNSSGTQITCITPKLTAGYYNIIVTNPGYKLNNKFYLHVINYNHMMPQINRRPRRNLPKINTPYIH